MYRVSLAKGKNYNLQVLDLHVEFSPSRPVKVFTDAEYNGSNDLAYYVGRGYLVATHFTESAVEEAPQAPLKNDLVVTELKAKAKEEGEVIMADGASKTAATAKKQETVKAVKAVESQDVKAESKATEKASSDAVKVEVKAPINGVKAPVNAPKTEAKAQANTTKTEAKAQQAKTDTQAVKTDTQAVKTDAQAAATKETVITTKTETKAQTQVDATETKTQVEPLKGTVVDNSSKQATKSKK